MRKDIQVNKSQTLKRLLQTTIEGNKLNYFKLFQKNFGQAIKY